jgi:hypothetical protein
MKITIDIDCTPEEARAFLGLPDVRPMQEAVMERLQERLLSALEAMEPEQLMRAWMQGGLAGPAGPFGAFGAEAAQGAAESAMQGWDQLQKAFWSQMAAASRGGESDKS